MSDTRTTYELAAELIGAYVQPLWPGALAMPFELHDENGRRIAMADDHLSGRHLLLVFLNDDTAVRTEDWLDRLVMYATRPEVGAVGARRIEEPLAQRLPGVRSPQGIERRSGLGSFHADRQGLQSPMKEVTR